MIINKSDILLPNDNIDLHKWSVIACDQFTNDIDYWNDIKNEINNSPSTINFIIPEIFLDNSKDINCEDNIKNALKNNIFKEVRNSYILVNRQTPFHKDRLGLMCCIDLEDYDFDPTKKNLIRASEGTVWQRVVPRIIVRENALIEFPHIMLLFDDRKENILENLYKNKNNFSKLYDFELNGGGGHISGFKIENVDLESKFQKLLDTEYLKSIFNTDEKLLFLVGDGNHSLATAKACWENLKKNSSSKNQQNNLARYCLVELCNINDNAIEFYPIHRVLFNYSNDLINGLKNLYKGEDYKLYKLYYNQKYEDYKLPKNTPLAIKLVQTYLENYLSSHKDTTIDYIHDKENVLKVCDNKNALGVFLPVIEKNQIFEYVIKNGVLPKKSFSIGKSIEKRYYLEGRKIK